jgi:transposase
LGWKPGKKIMYGNPYYDMMEQYKKDPKTWMKQSHQRSVIKAVFSAVKRRLEALSPPLSEVFNKWKLH